MLGQPARKRTHALDLVRVTSQPALIRDRRQLRQIVPELCLLIRFPEKLSVCKPRAQHALVPGANQPFRISRQVNDGKEMRREIAAAALDREVFLVTAHHRNENFVRKRKKRWVEPSKNHAGALIQICHQLEQASVLMGAQSFGRRETVKFCFNFLSPHARPARYEVLLELFLVITRTGNRDTSLSQKTMAIGVIPRLHVSVGKRYDLAVEQSNDPANRPNEARALRAGPDHRAWPRNFANGLRQYALQNFRRGFTKDKLPGDDIFALRRVHDRKLRDGQALLFRKTHGGARRLSGEIESHGLRWAADLARHIFLF